MRFRKAITRYFPNFLKLENKHVLRNFHLIEKMGGLWEIQTPDLTVNSRPLCQTEVRAHLQK